jgi:hypothetical protein
LEPFICGRSIFISVAEPEPMERQHFAGGGTKVFGPGSISGYVNSLRMLQKNPTIFILKFEVSVDNSSDDNTPDDNTPMTTSVIWGVVVWGVVILGVVIWGVVIWGVVIWGVVIWGVVIWGGVI